MIMTPKQKFYVTCVKRPIGFMGALIGIIVTSPIMIGSMVVLFFTNKNGLKGIFFTQDRPGKNEKVFRFIF